MAGAGRAEGEVGLSRAGSAPKRPTLTPNSLPPLGGRPLSLGETLSDCNRMRLGADERALPSSHR